MDKGNVKEYQVFLVLRHLLLHFFPIALQQLWVVQQQPIKTFENKQISHGHIGICGEFLWRLDALGCGKPSTVLWSTVGLTHTGLPTAQPIALFFLFLLFFSSHSFTMYTFPFLSHYLLFLPLNKCPVQAETHFSHKRKAELRGGKEL